MSKNFISETIRSFDYRKEAHFYKIEPHIKLDSMITPTGIIKNFNRVVGVAPVTQSVLGQTSHNPISDQIEIVHFLKLFAEHDFNIKAIREKVSEDIYPPMPGLTRQEAKNFCIFMRYNALYIAKYWIRVILSNPEYFSIEPIFRYFF